MSNTWGGGLEWMEGLDNLPNLISGGVGINEGLENSWKVISPVGVEAILFDTLKLNTKKLICFWLLSLLKTTQFWTKFILLDINIM